MTAARSLAQQQAGPDRRPAAPVVARTTAAGGVAPAQRLQRRLGNQATAGLLARSALHVSSPHDASEREATSRAAAVMRAQASTALPHGDAPAVERQAACAPVQCAAAAVAAPGRLDEHTSAAITSSLSGGAPLSAPLRSFMEPRLHADFAEVRIHTDASAERLSESVGAKAFTVGQHIFFGKGQYQPNTAAGQELIAHELVHTVQQGASPDGQPNVQRDEDGKSWWESAWDAVTDFVTDVGWEILERVAPRLVPILKKGPDAFFDWLKEKATSALEALFEHVTAPIQKLKGLDQQLAAEFGPMLETLRTAAAQIARNDCTPLREAAEKIERTAMAIITPIVKFVQPIIAKIKDIFGWLWDKIGAPVWDWIKEFAKDRWQDIQTVWGWIEDAAAWIWEKTARIRAWLAKAWTWFKNKLGIGEGPEGKDGLLQWLQRKLESAWNWLANKLAPFKKELAVIAATIGGVLLLVSPAGPILAVGAAVVGAVQGLRWIAAHWGKGNIIVEARVYLEKTLIPSLIGAAQGLAAAVTRMAQSISASLGKLAENLNRAASAVATSLLSFAISAVQWFADRATTFAKWAETSLHGVAETLTAGLSKLLAFLRKMLALFGKIAGVIADIFSLPFLLAGELWESIPKCIKDPIVDFLGPIILRQIAIFQELVKNEEAWKKTKADVTEIVKLIFKNHDLSAAIHATFLLILRVFNVPPELVTTIVAKAAAAWDTISKKPIEFLKTTVKAIGRGFKLLWDHFPAHLAFGLEEWLFGALAEQKIAKPSSWKDPKQVFNFVLDVMGLSVDHIFELLEKRFNPEQVKKIRDWSRRFSRAVDWVQQAIDTSKSPEQNAQGLWDQAKEFGKTLLSGVAEWVIGKVAEELAILAAAAAASGGLSEVLDIIRRVYKAILSAVRWARRILDMANQALDNISALAAGSFEKVGELFEQILHRGMPVVIGFLADQVGLSGVVDAIRDIIAKLRAKVDDALLWLIDAIKAGLAALIGAVKAGAGALLSWWKTSEPVPVAGGPSHTITFDDSHDPPVLIIRSDPTPYSTFLANHDMSKDPDEKRQKAYTAAKGTAAELDAAIAKAPGPKDGENSKKPADAAANIPSLVKKLASETAVFLTAGSGANTPIYSSEVGPYGSGVRVVGMHKPPNGSRPTAWSPHWETLNTRRFPGSTASFYVRGHLLNHNLGGTGSEWKNLTPITREANSRHLHDFETAVKEEAKKETGRPIEFVVSAKYGRSNAGGEPKLEQDETPELRAAANAVRLAEANVPSALHCSALAPDGAVIAKKVIENTIDQDAKYNISPKHAKTVDPSEGQP